MNKHLYYYLNKSKDDLHDELDKARYKKNVSSIDDDTMGVKITATTREKILIKFINIFRLLRYNDFVRALEEITNLSKRIKLHFYQLRKLKQPEYEINVKYFTDLMRVCYSIIVNSQARKKIN